MARWVALVAGVVVAAAGGSVALGDIFHLASGGRIEGELIEQSAGQYRIRTTLGTVVLSADAVARVESAPSPFQEYDRRRDAAADTAQAQLDLAKWCGEQGLMRERQTHLQHAIELDPDNEAARLEAGYVRVGEMWVNGRAASHRPRAAGAASATAGDSQPIDDPQKLAAAIQGSWRRRISTFRSGLLESSLDEQVARGRQRIDEIKDPLAIVPLVQVLGDGNRVCREVLVTALSRFSEDVATVNLAALALVDPDEDIRHRANIELKRRQDARVTGQFRKALESGDELLIRRGAEGLGVLKAKEAIPDLIPVLKDRQLKMVEVPVARYFGGLCGTFNGTVMQIGSVQVPVGATVAFANPASLVDLQRQMMNVTVYRTEVLDALRKITGQDFGFDMNAWARWYEENRS